METANNYEKLEVILKQENIKILSYFSYKTTTVGTTHIASTNDQESAMYRIVDRVISEAVAKLGFRRGNKEAVKCEIKGFDKPVYFCAFDFERIVCTEIRPEGEERKISEVPLRTLLTNRLRYIIEFEGGQTTKQTTKWKDIKFNDKHIADLRAEDYDAMPDEDLSGFFEHVIRRWSKAF